MKQATFCLVSLIVRCIAAEACEKAKEDLLFQCELSGDSPLRIVDDTYVPPTLAPTPPNQMPTMSPATPPPNQMPTMSPVAPESPPPALVPTPVPTPSPTSHPTESPTARPTALSLFNFLVGLSFDGGDALRNETSAQHRAFTWLSADQKVESYPDNVIVHRYVMATFYYSTNGDHWLMNDGWLDDGDECDWLDKSGKLSPLGQECFALVFVDETSLRRL